MRIHVNKQGITCTGFVQWTFHCVSIIISICKEFMVYFGVFEWFQGKYNRHVRVMTMEMSTQQQLVVCVTMDLHN